MYRAPYRSMDDLVTIHRPPTLVFAFVSDHTHDRLWKPTVVASYKLTAGPIRVGTRFRVVTAVWRFRVSGLVEVVEYDPPRWYTYRIHAPLFPVLAHLAFEPVAGGTRLWGQVALAPGPLLHGLSAILVRVLRQQSRPTFARLKHVMESLPAEGAEGP